MLLFINNFVVPNKQNRLCCQTKNQQSFRRHKTSSSGEKAIYTVRTILSSLTFSEKHLGVAGKCNNKHKNIKKLLLVVMFPFLETKDAWHHGQPGFFPSFRCDKDDFYGLLNN